MIAASVSDVITIDDQVVEKWSFENIIVYY